MKQLYFFKHVYIFYSFVLLLHILNVFLESRALNYIIGIFAILMLVISYPFATRLFKILGGCFIALGTIFSFSSDYSLIDVPVLLTTNMSLLALIMMLPWMNSVVKAGRFDKLLHSLLKSNVKNLGVLYPRSTTTMLSLTAFLNLSAATIAQDVLMDNLKHVNRKLANKFIMMSTLRGYSLALLWSPLEVLLAVSIFITGVDYIALLPWMLLISLIVFTLDAMWGRFYFKKFPYKTESSNQLFTGKRMIVMLIQLFSALVLFLLCVIGLGNLFHFEFILAVTLLILPFALCWSLVMKRGKSFWIVGWHTWKEKTNKMQNFVVLFTSLAFFSTTLNASQALEIIQIPFLMVADYPILIMVFIQLFFIILSVLGLHPVAAMGILGGIGGTLMEIINPISLAIIMTGSAVASVPISTYGLVVTITAINTRQNPYYITLHNLVYAFGFGLVSMIVAYLLL